MPKIIERTRRTPEQRIADLQAKIEAIKHKAERAKVKRNPALRHMSAAMKSVEKAQAETQDVATRKALDEVRATLSATLALNGVVVARGSAPRVRRTGGAGGTDASDLPDKLLAYVKAHPGQRGEEIAAALDTDTYSMRPSMKRLIEAGDVRTQGKNRGMRYFVGA
ncbi:MAG: hypothetical protein K8S98_00340 [Planctomycetes bacterium]|nr:hypothetical protein [Planctomycetota bacterium]